MTIVLSNEHSFWLKVIFGMPEDNGPSSSKIVERSFSVRLRASGAEAQGMTLVPGLSFIDDWSGVTDETGEAVPFSSAALLILLAHPFAGPALQEAWEDALPYEFWAACDLDDDADVGQPAATALVSETVHTDVSQIDVTTTAASKKIAGPDAAQTPPKPSSDSEN